MDDANSEQLQRLLNEGNIVERPPFPVSSIVEEGLARRKQGLPIPSGREFLLNPQNWNKSVIILLDPSANCRSLIVTRDQQAIDLAHASFKERLNPVGIWIRAHCELCGSSSISAPNYHIDRLVESLDGMRGWSFKLDDQPGQFVVSKKIQEISEDTRAQNLQDLGEMLDSLAIILGKGVHTWHLAVSPIPKDAPAVSWGKEEHMVPPLSAAELTRLSAGFKDTQRQEIAQALNRAYCETSKQAKLTALWSGCEHVLAGESERMLSDDTVDSIVEAAKGCRQLVGNRELTQRVSELLKDFLKKLQRRTRNDRISQRIATLLGIPVEDSRRQVSDIFKLRGRYVHSLDSSETNERADTALVFLHSALLKELDV